MFIAVVVRADGREVGRKGGGGGGGGGGGEFTRRGRGVLRLREHRN